jgi:hypothetical protein
MLEEDKGLLGAAGLQVCDEVFLKREGGLK